MRSEPLRIGTNNGRDERRPGDCGRVIRLPCVSAVIVGDPRGRAPTMTAPTTADANDERERGSAGFPNSPRVPAVGRLQRPRDGGTRLPDDCMQICMQ